MPPTEHLRIMWLILVTLSSYEFASVSPSIQDSITTEVSFQSPSTEDKTTTYILPDIATTEAENVTLLSSESTTATIKNSSTMASTHYMITKDTYKVQSTEENAISENTTGETIPATVLPDTTSTLSNNIFTTLSKSDETDSKLISTETFYTHSTAETTAETTSESLYGDVSSMSVGLGDAIIGASVAAAVTAVVVAAIIFIVMRKLRKRRNRLSINEVINGRNSHSFTVEPDLAGPMQMTMLAVNE